MKLVSKFALAFVLGSFAFAPSVYAKKENKGKNEAAAAPAQKQPVLSKAFQAAYAPAVNPFLKNDFAAAKAAWPGVKAAITTDDEKYQAGVFALQLGAKINDNALLDEGYEYLVQSSFTPAGLKQKVLFDRGNTSFNAKDYVSAVQKLSFAYDAGYRESEIESRIALSYAEQKKFAEAYDWVGRGIAGKKAAGQAPTIFLLRQAADYSQKLKNFTATNSWMKQLVTAEASTSNWADMINLYMRSANLSEPETLDMMRLMRINKAITRPIEYEIYVEMLDPRRYPVEALALLDEGVAAGHIQKTTADLKDYYSTAAQLAPEDIRGLPATEASARSSTSGNVTSLTGDAFFSQGKYDIAKSLYELALTKGKITDKDGIDRADRTIMRLGIAKAQQKDWAGAKAEFAKIPGGKRKEMAEYWNMFVDQQMAKPAS